MGKVGGNKISHPSRTSNPSILGHSKAKLLLSNTNLGKPAHLLEVHHQESPTRIFKL